MIGCHRRKVGRISCFFQEKSIYPPPPLLFTSDGAVGVRSSSSSGRSRVEGRFVMDGIEFVCAAMAADWTHLRRCWRKA